MEYLKLNFGGILFSLTSYILLTRGSLFCNSSKSRKEYFVLTCGPASLSTTVPKAKGEDGDSCSDDGSSGDEENQTVSLVYRDLNFHASFSHFW